MTKFHEFLKIYSGGTVQAGKAAAVAVLHQLKLHISKLIPDSSSVLTAEIAAIYKALKVVHANPPPKEKGSYYLRLQIISTNYQENSF